MSEGPLSDLQILDGFRAGTLPAFPHREHVRVAWLYLGEAPIESAVPAFCRDLRKFAAAKGAHGLFHATITWAFLILVNERRVAGETFEGFAERNADLFARKPSILDRYYSAETLSSARARERFVFPDRAPAA